MARMARTMRRALIGAGAALVALIALVALVGAFLPRTHVATRSASLAAPPATVFALIADVRQAAAWRRSLSGLEMLPPVDGRVRFVEVRGGDRLTLEIVEQQPPTRLVTRIADPDLPFGGTWTFELEAQGRGTRLTITERGEIHNVIFRAVARFVLGYHASIDEYLGDLQTRLGGGAAPSS
jgi:uncharacterized protein YndB with AHSA1/START domain